MRDDLFDDGAANPIGCGERGKVGRQAAALLRGEMVGGAAARITASAAGRDLKFSLSQDARRGGAKKPGIAQVPGRAPAGSIPAGGAGPRRGAARSGWDLPESLY